MKEKTCTKCGGKCQRVHAPPERTFAYDYICKVCKYVNVLGKDIPFYFYI